MNSSREVSVAAHALYRLLSVLLAVSQVACSSTPNVVKPTTLSLISTGSGVPVTVGALQFTVTSSPSALGNFQLNYTVKNVSTAQVRYSIAGCTRDIRLYAGTVRAFSLLELNDPCAPEGLTFLLEAGDQQSWSVGFPVVRVLDHLTTGTYTIMGTLPNIQPEVEVSAGVVQAR